MIVNVCFASYQSNIRVIIYKEEDKIDVENLTKIFLKYFYMDRDGVGYKIIADQNSFYEAKFLSLDNTLAKNNIGWNPVFTPTQSIKFSAEWYKTYLENKKLILKFTENQINEFFALAF